MKINIYYGGRGLMDDPTFYVMNKLADVLAELNVTVEKFRLHEYKNNITTLPETLKNADGIILATTVEWYGIGGYMQQFLDACWLYGDKGKISQIYMCPVVMSTTYGEREAKLNLSLAWEILGGLPCSGLCGYIPDTIELEMNVDYNSIIERKAENLYRTIHKKVASLPASNQAVKNAVAVTKTIDLTPQESEQLSHYVSDDSYVQTQKQDIQELASMFKDMLGNKSGDEEQEFIKEFEANFKPQPGFSAIYKFVMENKKKPFIVDVNKAYLKCYYGVTNQTDIEINLTSDILIDIILAKESFQKAFFVGSMKVKGDLKKFRTLDQLFPFGNETK